MPRYHWWVVFSPTLFTFSHHTHFLLFYVKQKRYHCPQHLSYSWIMAPAFLGPGIDSEKKKVHQQSTFSILGNMHMRMSQTQGKIWEITDCTHELVLSQNWLLCLVHMYLHILFMHKSFHFCAQSNIMTCRSFLELESWVVLFSFQIILKLYV